jgi:hypothetical protein
MTFRTFFMALFSYAKIGISGETSPPAPLHKWSGAVQATQVLKKQGILKKTGFNGVRFYVF